MSEQVLTMSSQSPPIDSSTYTPIQSFTFPANKPSPIPIPRTTSPDKHQRNPSQDVQLKSPEKPNPEQLKPNPHPYAIKTTSTALLSRSNSSSSKSSRHHYIPSTPPSNAKRHRTNSSVSNIELPRPLPIPPPSPSPTDSENPHTGPPPTHQPRRLKQSDTDFAPSPTPLSTPLTLEDLPPNPKQWTPSQLSVYLATALRISGSGPGELPAPIANDIANFMRERRISGRVFLRLGEEELEGYGMNKLWRTALLGASRNLRQNVLKGRIWGVPDDDNSSPPSPSSHEASTPSRPVIRDKEDDETTPNNRKSVFIKRPMYSSAESGSSADDLSDTSSTLKLPLLPTSISDGTGSSRFKSISRGSTRSRKTGRMLAMNGFFEPPGQTSGSPGESSPSTFSFPSPGGKHRNGRVKGMAKGFEAIASVDEGAFDLERSPSPTKEVSASPTHSRMLSGESKDRILRDMEFLKMSGRVKSERQRRTSMSSESEMGSPTKSRMVVDLPVESPTGMLAHEDEDDEDYIGSTVKRNHPPPTDSGMPTWDFEQSTVKRHHTGSSSVSSTSSSSSRPLPMPPGPPPVCLPSPSLLGKNALPSISTTTSSTMSPIPTPPPSAGGVAGEEELTVEELLALQGAGGSVRRKGGKGKGQAKGIRKRVGVHAWEDDDQDEGGDLGFVTVKRAPVQTQPNSSTPSLTSPRPSVASPIHPVALTAPIPDSRPSSSSPSSLSVSVSPEDMAKAKRVITPISSSVEILPSRKLTPIPIAPMASPMRVTTELSPDGGGGLGGGAGGGSGVGGSLEVGGIVHPKPVTVVEREVVGTVGMGTVGRMEEMVRCEREREREEEVVVRPLPTPPDDRMFVVAPLTAIVSAEVGSAKEREKEETLLVTEEAKTVNKTVVVVPQEEEEDEDEEEELRALIADVLKTKSQVEAMKNRLGEVEQNVEELKREVEEAEEKFEGGTVRPLERKKSSSTSSTPKEEGEEEDRREVVPATSETESATEKARRFLLSALEGGPVFDGERFSNPQSVVDLPPYIALVGLGVCMVVMNVLLKKRR